MALALNFKFSFVMNLLIFMNLLNALYLGSIASTLVNDKPPFIIGDHLTKDFYSLFKIRPEANVDLEALGREYQSLKAL